jgi:hypothetical protein
MKTKFFVLASLLIASLASCEESEIINPTTTGKTPDEIPQLEERAMLDFSIAIPIGKATGVAANVYTDIRSIDVFLFNETGTMDEIGHIRFDDMSKFSLSQSGDETVYTLEAPGIVTSPGIKLIHIGLNVPEDAFSDFSGQEIDLIEAVKGIRDDNDPANAMTLFTDARLFILEKDQIQPMSIKEKHFQWFTGQEVVTTDPWATPWESDDEVVEI